MKRGTKAACSAALVAVMLAGGCLLQACSQQSAPADLPKTESRTASREEASSAGAVPEKGEPEEPALKGINDLTGMPMDEAKENNRPLAVMINNIDIAQPLMGVSQSDVMYECLAEGGITRIMACFKDPSGVAESAASAAPGPIIFGSPRAWMRFICIPAAVRTPMPCWAAGSSTSLTWIRI